MSGWESPSAAAGWMEEARRDLSYQSIVLPLLMDTLGPVEGTRLLDLGCGEGQGMRSVAAAGGRVIGCDINRHLVHQAGGGLVLRLPDLGAIRGEVFDTAYAVLLLDHIGDLQAFFREAARVVVPAGALVVVGNHPYSTAPGAAVVIDQTDGEAFWRWGEYLKEGISEEDMGGSAVEFYHRPLGTLLTAAAEAGWSLWRLSEHATEGDPSDSLEAARSGLPRLLAARWRKEY